MCVGMLGWSPSVFWDSSPIEVFMALEGFQEFNGATEAPMRRDELEDLMELYPDE